MARSKNQIKTVQLTLATTATLVGYLQDLVSTGLYGKTQTEAAERLLAFTLDGMVRSGKLRERRGSAEHEIPEKSGGNDEP